MSSPVVTTRLEEARSKQARRRSLGGKADSLGMQEGNHLTDLVHLGAILQGKSGSSEDTGEKKSRENYATFVIGHWSYEGNGSEAPLLIAVLKLAKGSENLKSQLFLEAKRRGLVTEEDHVILLTEVPTNLHAEMAIVKYVCDLGYEKQNLAGLLEIYCSGKGVCLDCSGWMTKHGIAHSPLSLKPSPTGWKNPLSGALYKASGDDLTYTKGGLEMSDFNRQDGGAYQTYKATKS